MCGFRSVPTNQRIWREFVLVYLYEYTVPVKIEEKDGSSYLKFPKYYLGPFSICWDHRSYAGTIACILGLYIVCWNHRLYAGTIDCMLGP